MLTINYVNLIQTSLLTVALLGVVLLWQEKAYRYICALFVLVIIASVFNLLEELGITRHIYLVTPVFILGFGPAIYLAVRQLIGQAVTPWHWLHFVPMLLALPFTGYTDAVILLGTIWRVVYAGLTLYMLYGFSNTVFNWRSDAYELSFKWLSVAVLVMTVVSVLNLLRLNLQVELGHELNVFGQGISTLVSLVFFVFLIQQLVHKKSAILDLLSTNLMQAETANDPTEAEAGDPAYAKVYQHLLDQFDLHQWFTTPRLTLQQLSELTGLQTRDVSRAINLHAGCNFNDFINKWRLDYVTQRMQQEPDTSLLTLATDAGFNAKTTFNAVFRKHHGMTPSVYRSQLNSSH
jgi:AraC-like DNA-binding protein